jgi:hypothetical protein
MTTKAFDCVEMKRRAQRGLRAALEGKTPEVQAIEIARRAEGNPIWQELLRRKAQTASTKRARGGR